MSQKKVGRTGWSVTDLIGTADFLGVTPDALMDDSVLIRAEAGYKNPRRSEGLGSSCDWA